MKKQILTAACALALIAGTLTATTANAQVVVRIGPPAPIVETVPPRPWPDAVWIRGYHRWDGNAYVWVPGHYEHPPHPHARWVDGYWANRHGGHVWIEGHWR